MSQMQTSGTHRSTHTTAVQSPGDRAATRTTRGFAAFVGVPVAVMAAVLMPVVAAAVGVAVAVTAGTVVAARRRPDRRTGPPDDEVQTRSRTDSTTAGVTAD